MVHFIDVTIITISIKMSIMFYIRYKYNILYFVFALTFPNMGIITANSKKFKDEDSSIEVMVKKLSKTAKMDMHATSEHTRDI